MTTKSGRSFVMSKGNFATFALNYDTELKLSDGNMFCVCAESFRCTSVFLSFSSQFHCHYSPAESTTLLSSLLKCNVDNRVNSYTTVMLPGGTFHEIGERMTVRPTELPPSMTKIKAVAPPERQYSLRIGESSFFFYRCGSRGRVRWFWPDYRFDVPHFVSTV